MYGIFFVGGMVFRDLDLTMFMLTLLVGLAIFVAWQVVKIIIGAVKRMTVAIWDLARTRYVIVFKF